MISFVICIPAIKVGFDKKMIMLLIAEPSS